MLLNNLLAHLEFLTCTCIYLMTFLKENWKKATSILLHPWSCWCLLWCFDQVFISAVFLMVEMTAELHLNQKLDNRNNRDQRWIEYTGRSRVNPSHLCHQNFCSMATNINSVAPHSKWPKYKNRAISHAEHNLPGNIFHTDARNLPLSILSSSHTPTREQTHTPSSF